MKPIETNPTTGQKSWTEQPGDTYLITGETVLGRRFTKQCSNWAHASGINLYRGSKWLVRDGKRYLISRVFN